MLEQTLLNYETFQSTFRVEDIEAELSGSLETGLNVCYECLDRHAATDKVALYWESQDGRSATYTFAELQALSARFANFLHEQGIRPGDIVAGLLPRTPELMVVALGTLRTGAVYQALFTAFGPKALEYRLARSGAKLIVTDIVNRPKLDELAALPPVMTVDSGNAKTVRPGELNFWDEVNRQPANFTPVMCMADDPFLLLFTSGTVGLAKGIAVLIKALLSFIVYMRYGIGLRDDDSFWNVADPGWAYGLYYAVIGALLLGHATVLYDGPFTAESTYRILAKYGITNLAAAPSAYRVLMAAGAERAGQIFGQLRVANSAGEPLNPEVIRWFEQHMGCSIYDQYGQTEHAMLVCNYHTLAHVRHSGAMGLPLPGFRIVMLDDEFREIGPGQVGQLAIDRTQSPLYWFPGYWQQETVSCYHGPYYLTGDKVEMYEDGTLTFVGRSDDIIKSSGYRIGPFEVESCLIEHPAVAESAVIGKPDPKRNEVVKAFVVLRAGYEPTPELAGALQQFVKQRLAAHAYPREIEFVLALPKTPSGKIQRFMLRQQEIENLKADVVQTMRQGE